MTSADFYDAFIADINRQTALKASRINVSDRADNAMALALGGDRVNRVVVEWSAERGVERSAFLGITGGLVDPTMASAADRFREAWRAGDKEAIEQATVTLRTMAALCQ